MNPLFRVVSLFVRLFTRPLTNYLKISLSYKQDRNPFIRNSILNLGQLYHRINIRIQRRIMNMSGHDSYIKPLTDEKALENGAEFAGEIIAYGILLSWGLYEINKISVESKAKEDKYLESITNIHTRLSGVEYNYKEILDTLKIIQKQTNKNYINEGTWTDE